MAETVGFRIKIDGADELTKTELRLAEINKELREAKKQQNTPVYGKLRREQLALQETAKGLRKDIRNQIKDWQDVKKGVPTDSLIGLSKKYRELTNEVSKMSRAQRESQFGQRMISEAREVKSELDRVQQSMKNFRGNVGNYRSALGGAGLQVLSGVGIATGLSEVVGQVSALVRESKELAQEAKGVEFAFNRIEGSAQALIRSREATKGLLSDLDIQKAAVEFDNFNINLELMPELLQFVALRAAQTGKSFDHLRDSLVEGLAKESRLRIDNLGISLTDLNAQLEKSPNFVAAVAEIAKREVAEAGDVIGEAGNAQQQFNASLQNAQVAIGRLMNSSLNPLLGMWSRVLNSLFQINEETESQADKLKASQIEANSLFSTLINLDDRLRKLDEDTVEYNATADAKKDVLDQINSQYQEYLPNLLTEKTSTEDLIAAQRTLNDELLKKQIVLGYQEEIAEAVRQEVEARKVLANNERLRASQAAKNQSDQLLGIGGSPEAARQAEQGANLILGISDNLAKQQVSDAESAREEVTSTYEELSSQVGESLSRLLSDFNNFSGELSGVGDDSAPINSIAGMQAALSKLRDQIEKTPDTDKGLLESLSVKAIALEDKIKAAKDELFALEDAARGGQLASDLTSNIDKETAEEFANMRKSANEEVRNSDKELFDQRIADLEFFKNLEKEALKEVNDETINLENEARDQARKADEQEFEAQLELIKRIEEEKRRAYFETANIAADAAFEIFHNSAQRQYDAQTKALQDEYQVRIDAAQGNTEEQKRLQEELAAKEEEINRKAFEKNKQRQIAEALIKGALAALQSLANTTLPFPASLSSLLPIAAQTAANVAVISSQSYADGGFTGFKGIKDLNLPHRKITGYVHDNEYVAPTEQIEKYPQLFRALDMERRGFAEGGFTSPVLPQLDYEAMLMGNLVAHELNKGLFGAGSNDMIRQAVFEGAKEGARIGAMEGARAGTSEGSKEGSKEGVIEASRETEFSRIRTERANKNLKE